MSSDEGDDAKIALRLRATRNSLLDDMRAYTRRLDEMITLGEEVGWYWLAHELRHQKDGLQGMIRMYEETLSDPKPKNRP